MIHAAPSVAGQDGAGQADPDGAQEDQRRWEHPIDEARSLILRPQRMLTGMEWTDLVAVQSSQVGGTERGLVVPRGNEVDSMSPS